VDARISLVTLGVEDLERALGFYRDGLRWPLSSASGDDVAFFRTGGIVLALYPRDLLTDDARVTPKGPDSVGLLSLATWPSVSR